MARARRRRPRAAWRTGAAGAFCALLALLLAACGGTPHVSLPTGPYSPKPNIVFVLTDDLDSGLVKYMPHVLALQRAGMSFDNYTVTDSLCCPSRASIFSGKFPHDTGVYENVPPNGGFGGFYNRGEEKHTFATALQSAGYRTALFGKYLNGYPVGPNGYGYPTDYVPPGWNEWGGSSNGYAGYNYDINRNHDLEYYGRAPNDYINGHLNEWARNFIVSSAAARAPFFLEVATFSPHSPFTPAPRDAHTFTGLRLPRPPDFNRVPAQAPPWLAHRTPLTHAEIASLTHAYIKRVEAVQSVDRMIGDLEATLAKTGQLKNTVFVFSSDNGYHMGEHGLLRGKLTAFETDIRVPLVVAGPGIPAGGVNHDVTENIDLAPTFEQLGGATPPPSVDGRSLVPLLHGHNPPWRTIALVEHHGHDFAADDPDAQSLGAGNPPSYDAIRTPNWIYVTYVTGGQEYYNLKADPYENDNLAPSLSATRLARLHAEVDALKNCHGAASCWRAARPQPAPIP